MKPFTVVIFFVGYLVAFGSANSITIHNVAVPVQPNGPPTNQAPGLHHMIYELTGLFSDMQGAVMSGDTDAASYDLQAIFDTLQELSTLVNNPAAKIYIEEVQEEVSAALNKVKLGRTNMIEDVEGVMSMLGNGAKSAVNPGMGIILDYYSHNSGLNEFFNSFAGGESIGGTDAEGEEYNPIEPAGDLPPAVGTFW